MGTATWSVRRRLAALWLWAAGTVLLLSFSYLLHSGLSLRHKGHLFMLLERPMSLARRCEPQDPG